MKIKRTSKRLIVYGKHPYFVKNRDLWLKLRNGDVIDLPKDDYETVKEVFGETIELVEIKTETVHKPKINNVSFDSLDSKDTKGATNGND